MNYTNFIDKKVIIRSYGAGVFYCTLKAKEGTEVELADCRRIWEWDGAASLSELAISGVAYPDGCNFSVSVPSIIITGVLEVIPTSEKASKNIEAVPVWKISK